MTNPYQKMNTKLFVTLTNKTNDINQAQIISGNNLSITANSGDIKNIGANIGSVGNLNLTTLQGNILNTAIIATNDTNLLASNPDSYISNFNFLNPAKNIKSELINSSAIKGGSISINAANDFTNLAADIATTRNTLADNSVTSGNLAVTAGNDINISTLQLHNHSETSWGNGKKGGTDISDAVSNISSNINSGGNLSLTTTATGPGYVAEVANAAAKTASDQARYNNELAAYNIALADYQAKQAQLIANPGMAKFIRLTAPTPPSAPIVYAASSDINIVGSNLSSNGNLNLVSKDNVNILSALNSSYSYSESHKKGTTYQKSSSDTAIDITNLSSNLNATNGDININSGTDTNIIASNLTGTNGNIIVGKYTDLNQLSATYGQEIINDDAKLTIKSGQDYHSKSHTETKIKTDNTAIVVGAVAAVAVTAATGGAGLALVAAAAGGAATGAQGKKGKTTTDEITEIIQKASTLNFSGDLNTQSASDTNITASNLTANNATMLTGKLRDSVTGIDTITNASAKLNINSAFNIKDTNSTTEKVRPNYVGIAVVAGGSAYLSSMGEKALTKSLEAYISSGAIKATASTPWLIYTENSLNSNLDPNQKSFMDPILNIRSGSSSSNHQETEIKTNLNFNNLTTQ